MASSMLLDEFALAVPFLAALLISFVSSLGGVSGAFLLLPFQIYFLGSGEPAVSATNHFYNVVAIPAGAARIFREGRMFWTLGIILALGSGPGGALGAWIRVHLLGDPFRFQVFAALVLLFLATRLLVPPPATTRVPIDQMIFESKELRGRHLHFIFAHQNYSVSIPLLLLVSLGAGTIGGAYGIGGGALLASFLIGWLRMPVHAIAGSLLGSTFLTSLVSVGAFHHFSRGAAGADWSLGLLLGLGGALGIYLGGRCQRFVSALLIRYVLAFLVLALAVSFGFQSFVY